MSELVVMDVMPRATVRGLVEASAWGMTTCQGNNPPQGSDQQMHAAGHGLIRSDV